MLQPERGREGNSNSLSAFSELRDAVQAQGLLKRQPWYYSGMVVLLSGLLVCGMVAFFLTPVFPLQLANAVLLAFVFGQLGLLGHDAGHNQIFASRRWNTILGRICGNLLLGMGLD